MLKVENLVSHYGVSQILFGLSFFVEEGEFVTLIGRNGMGKTTTVNSVMGIVKSTSGIVSFKGRDVANLATFKIAKLGIGLVPEGRHIFPNLSVFENLYATAANRLSKENPWSIGRIFELFPELKKRENHMGNLLSGGEQQMLAISRALMTNPDLLILDEATEGLAPLVRQEIWGCLSRLKNEGQSILIIDKNISDLCRIADRHNIIEKGEIVWTGTSNELISQPNTQSKYLGV